MCVYVSVCVCVYIYIKTHTHIHIYDFYIIAYFNTIIGWKTPSSV